MPARVNGLEEIGFGIELFHSDSASQACRMHWINFALVTQHKGFFWGGNQTVLTPFQLPEKTREENMLIIYHPSPLSRAVAGRDTGAQLTVKNLKFIKKNYRQHFLIKRALARTCPIYSAALFQQDNDTSGGPKAPSFELGRNQNLLINFK